MKAGKQPLHCVHYPEHCSRIHNGQQPRILNIRLTTRDKPIYYVGICANHQPGTPSDLYNFAAIYWTILTIPDTFARSYWLLSTWVCDCVLCTTCEHASVVFISIIEPTTVTSGVSLTPVLLCHSSECESAVGSNKEVSILQTVGSKLLTKDQLDIRYSTKAYNRLHLPPALENSIDETWKVRCLQNPKLWNGSKFRLHSFDLDSTGRLIWNLGLTCYKDFLGTNFSSHATEIQQLGETLQANKQAYMADPLGVGALLLTSDNYAVLMRRSSTCAEAAGCYDIPGGHPEPEEIEGGGSLLSNTGSIIDQVHANSIRDEIFQSILREIRDEVNIPLDKLSEPLLLGVALNMTSHGRPSSEYLVRTSLSSTEVKSLYEIGTQSEADETVEILALPYREVLNIEKSNLWNKLAPSAKGCFLLYLRHLSAKTA